MHLRQLSILIADDHEVIRRALRSLLLSRPEWTVCGEAADGNEAVRMTRDQRPDLVLMDISMPEMNGVQATKTIRREFPETRVLIISQNDPEVTKKQAQEAGASGYVAKADLSRSLLGAIEKVTKNGNGSARSDRDAPAGIPETQDRLPWLAGGGEMGALMRTRDWSDNPLGAPENWPESLQLSASICVSSRFDLIVWWGPDLIMLYNDSYRRTLGGKHPIALGRPGREVYPEIWDVIGPMLEQVLQTGEATLSLDLLLLLERNGYPEETYHTFSYTPIRDRQGTIVGVITPVTETTEQVISSRRLLTLRDLAARSVDAKNENESWKFAAHALSTNPYDFSCAVLYRVDDHATTAIAMARVGVCSDDPFFLNEIELDGASGTTLAPTLAKAINTGLPVELNEKSGLQLSLPGGFWGASPSELIVLPIAQAGQEKAIGALVVGANCHKKLDDDYRGFLSLVSGQIAKSIADTRLLDLERRRAEALAHSNARRREAEERLNLALEVGRIGTWDIELATNVMFWSPGEYELFGYRPQECTPSWEMWKRRIHPEDLPHVLEQWEAAKKEHRDLRIECRVCLPGGISRWIEGKARFFYDSVGRPYRAIGASRDITERKKTEESLRTGRERLLQEVKGQRVALERTAEKVATQAELLDLANDAAFISDLENRITYWNHGAERLYGWKKEEAIGRNASELLQTEFPVSYQDVLSALTSKGVWEGELRQTTRYGHRMSVASRWTYRRDPEGIPVGWLEINSDLTLQKKAQEAARRLSARILQVQDLERRKLARELHDSLGQYLASLKVNIRSSLRNIDAVHPRKLLTECVEILDRCLTETRTISYLLHPPLLDETGLASAIRWYVEGFSQRSGISVSLQLPDTIPRFSDEIETTVFRILQESLTNAHRHAKTERAQISVELRPFTIALTVRDYGCGIAADRLRSFLERNEGMGVGLGGMRERVRELGGTLTVTSGEDNLGTIVSVEIPVVAREADNLGAGESVRAQGAS
jgi:PAS domain S-box-containing protein